MVSRSAAIQHKGSKPSSIAVILCPPGRAAGQDGQEELLRRISLKFSVNDCRQRAGYASQLWAGRWVGRPGGSCCLQSGTDPFLLMVENPM